MNTLTDDARDRLVRVALADKESVMYKGMIKMLEECEASARRARMTQPYVVLPFYVDELEVAALEAQFGVSIKVRGSISRIVATPRVAGLIFLLESALIEHAGGCNRTLLLIDGDVMSVAAIGLEGRIVERTSATPRLASGYFMEDEHLRRYVSNRASAVNAVADVLVREQRDGGGEHFWPVIRTDGPRVDSIVVNHFKTPVGPRQLAWLAYKRGAIVYGAIPFQFDMLVASSGKLECFPGKFYIDREADVLTLVPEADATLSISHPYSSWSEIVRSNSVVVDGKEFLCEKYKSLEGILYYTLRPLEAEFEAPEVLRTSYFDTASVGVTQLTFPKVRLSGEGVPVGWERGVVRILTSRCEKVMSRLMTSVNDVVTPTEAFVALMDYNNTVVNSLDTVRVAERMEVDEERDVALALALHVNWTRHAARGTFNTLLDAIKFRFSVRDTTLSGFALVALSAWWSKPRIGNSCCEDELPTAKVVDWCGRDFSVVMRDVDPWIEVVQEVGNFVESSGKLYSWFPKPPFVRGSKWYLDILNTARKAVGSVDDSFVGGDTAELKPLASSILKVVKRHIEDTGVRFGARTKGNCVLLDEFEEDVDASKFELTEQKSKLVTKMRQEQAAMNETPIARLMVKRHLMNNEEPVVVPVVPVEPVSAIRDDLLMCNGGVIDRDVVTTGYRISEVDVMKSSEGVFSLNDAKRAIPKQRWVRYPKVDAGVEGKRVASQTALTAALFKRNIGVPANRGSVDLETVPAKAVEKIIQVCYREGWEDILERHLNTGLWEPNTPDIESFVANIEEKKVKGLLDEFFLEGTVDLTRWMLMAKGKIKPSRDATASQKVDHSQTILYLENASTNAMYSSMMRRFKDCVDECLRPEVSLNPQCSDEDHERWYNSLESHRKSCQVTYSYSADIKCYDRAQEHVALRIDLEFYKRHGLSLDRLKIWEQTHGPKRAISMMFGVVLVMTLGGVSGLWKTLMRNGVVNLASMLVSTGLKRSDVVMIDIKGDDMDAEFSRPIQVETAVDRLSLTFNLSAKFFTADVRYMCKTFRIKHDGRWYFVADPWARVQSMLTPLWIGNKEDDLTERWMSLRADLRHYDNGALVDLVAEAAQVFYSVDRPLYGMARGLAAVVEDRGKFINMFNAPVLAG